MPAFPNKFPGTCRICQSPVAKGAGLCEKIDGAWTCRCASQCEPKAAAAPQQAVVGDLSAILALFAKAKTHLKFPAIVLSVTEALSVRISVAGSRAKVPGSLTVTDAERSEEGRDWFGRILLDGKLQTSRLGEQHMPALAERLRAFAADPVKVAGDEGRLHGRCIFCRLPLSDERSTAVGYGKKCAENFGIAWGAKPSEFAAAA